MGIAIPQSMLDEIHQTDEVLAVTDRINAVDLQRQAWFLSLSRGRSFRLDLSHIGFEPDQCDVIVDALAATNRFKHISRAGGYHVINLDLHPHVPTDIEAVFEICSKRIKEVLKFQEGQLASRLMPSWTY